MYVECHHDHIGSEMSLVPDRRQQPWPGVVGRDMGRSGVFWRLYILYRRRSSCNGRARKEIVDELGKLVLLVGRARASQGSGLQRWLITR